MRDSITKILKKAADNIYNVSIDKDIIFKIEQIVDPVSYTHLTLPTIYSV